MFQFLALVSFFSFSLQISFRCIPNNNNINSKLFTERGSWQNKICFLHLLLLDLFKISLSFFCLANKINTTSATKNIMARTLSINIQLKTTNEYINYTGFLPSWHVAKYLESISFKKQDSTIECFWVHKTFWNMFETCNHCLP